MDILAGLLASTSFPHRGLAVLSVEPFARLAERRGVRPHKRMDATQDQLPLGIESPRAGFRRRSRHPRRHSRRSRSPAVDSQMNLIELVTSVFGINTDEARDVLHLLQVRNVYPPATEYFQPLIHQPAHARHVHRAYPQNLGCPLHAVGFGLRLGRVTAELRHRWLRRRVVRAAPIELLRPRPQIPCDLLRVRRGHLPRPSRRVPHDDADLGLGPVGVVELDPSGRAWSARVLARVFALLDDELVRAEQPH